MYRTLYLYVALGVLVIAGSAIAQVPGSSPITGTSPGAQIPSGSTTYGTSPVPGMNRGTPGYGPGGSFAPSALPLETPNTGSTFTGSTFGSPPGVTSGGVGVPQPSVPGSSIGTTNSSGFVPSTSTSTFASPPLAPSALPTPTNPCNTGSSFGLRPSTIGSGTTSGLSLPTAPNPSAQSGSIMPGTSASIFDPSSCRP